MFVRTRAFRAVQEENERLVQALEQARQFLAHYKAQENDVAAALVTAQTEGRRHREEAAQEARRVVEEAVSRANALKAGALAEVAAAEKELERLRTTRNELAESIRHALQELANVPALGSLQQSVRQEQQPFENKVATYATATPQPVSVGSSVGSSSSEPDQGGLARGFAASGTGNPFLSQLSHAPLSTTSPESAASPGLSQRMVSAIAVTAIVAAVFAVGLGIWARSRPARPNESRQLADNPQAAISQVQTQAGVAAGRPAGTNYASGRPLAVRLQIRRGVWVRADVDGKRALSRLVAKGESLDFTANEIMSLRVGDAGALTVSVNGANPVPFGRDGAVLTRRFSVARAQPSTGAPADAKLTGPQPSMRPSAPTEPARAPMNVLAAAVSATDTVRNPDGPAPVEGALAPAFETQATAPLPAATSVDLSAPQTPGVDEPAPAASTEAEEVLAKHREYIGALVARDSSAVQRLATDGFSATVPFLDRTSTRLPLRIDKESVEVRGVGAVVSGTVVETLLGSDGRPMGEAMWLFSEVWINRDGRWMLLNARFARPPGK